MKTNKVFMTPTMAKTFNNAFYSPEDDVRFGWSYYKDSDELFVCTPDDNIIAFSLLSDALKRIIWNDIIENVAKANSNINCQAEIEVYSSDAWPTNLAKLEQLIREQLIYLRTVKNIKDFSQDDMIELIHGFAVELNFKNIDIKFAFNHEGIPYQPYTVFDCTLNKHKCYIYIKNFNINDI